jgi:hypothetical protein
MSVLGKEFEGGEQAYVRVELARVDYGLLIEREGVSIEHPYGNASERLGFTWANENKQWIPEVILDSEQKPDVILLYDVQDNGRQVSVLLRAEIESLTHVSPAVSPEIKALVAKAKIGKDERLKSIARSERNRKKQLLAKIPKNPLFKTAEEADKQYRDRMEKMNGRQ